ncbi:MAG: D-alanine--D-alanine ligase family protein [Actinomycetota bacterium]
MKGSTRLRVLLLFGGRSEEHEVSRVSARHVAAALDPARYEVIPVGITREGTWLLPDTARKVLGGGPLEVPERAFEVEGDHVALLPDPARRAMVPLDGARPVASGPIDVALPVLHGPFGEDGTVQGLLELAGIPYVGSGVLGSAVGMDKEKMKLLFQAHGLPVAPFVTIRTNEWASSPERVLDRAASLGFPVFAKPANLGSSVGVTKCEGRDALRAGIVEALRHDRKVVVEEAIPGREIECGVLGNDEPEVSVCGEVVPGREFYDYAAKYLEGDSQVIVPADLPGEACGLIRRYAIEAFRAIDAAGMARVDFFYDEGGRGVVVSEINTIPGFTTISMYPKLWQASGVSYRELIDRLIELALERHAGRPRGEEIPPPAG